MVTDTSTLLPEGLTLAATTYAAAGTALGWAAVTLDEYVLHQVSRVDTAAAPPEHRPDAGFHHLR